MIKGLGADAQILAVRFDNLKEGAPARSSPQRSCGGVDASSAPAASSPSASASATPVPRS